jgi:acylphosphatase
MKSRPVMIARRVHYAGRVQGVGFRATVYDISSDHSGVAGYVRNLTDGRVEVVAQGKARTIAAFLLAIEHRLERNIETTEIAELPVAEALFGFAIWPTSPG